MILIIADSLGGIIRIVMNGADQIVIPESDSSVFSLTTADAADHLKRVKSLCDLQRSRLVERFKSSRLGSLKEEMGKEIKVSVVIPTFNSECYVTDAIDSVLAQTFSDFEVVVVDDGSNDKTERVVVEKYGDRVHYHYKENGGVSSARNYGIEKAIGKYIAFLDADDAWIPEKLEKQIAALESNSENKACYTSFLICDEKLDPVGINRSERRADTLTDLLLFGNVVATPSTVIAEKQLFEKVGGFDHDLSQCADWEIWIRLAIHTEFFYLDEPLLKYRQHDSNMSNDAGLLERDSVLLLEKSFGLPNLPDNLKQKKNEALARNYMVLAGTYFRVNAYRDFLRCLQKSIALDYTQSRHLLEFLKRLVKNQFASIGRRL